MYVCMYVCMCVYGLQSFITMGIYVNSLDKQENGFHNIISAHVTIRLR